MLPVVTIMICDTNRYFSQGLEAVLHQYFTNKGLSPHFLTSDPRGFRADLVFQSHDFYMGHQRLCQHAHPCSRPKVIMIENRPCGPYPGRATPRCVCMRGNIYRNNDREEMLLEVERVLSLSPSQHGDCPQCIQTLTPREQHILSSIKYGMRSSQIATFLRLSPKTVSAHKRKAMLKLGILRNTELYHWLRCGGLEKELRNTL